jgi:UDP-N-acetyl-D-mannosaminouronate:lipid I N-acetyl-D-mannosaminouronosyltransferase
MNKRDFTSKEDDFPQDVASVGGLAITGFKSLSAAADDIISEAQSSGGFAVAINAEKIVNYLHDPALFALLAQASLRYPDGVGAVMALKRKGVLSARIAGADLWLEVLIRAAAHHLMLRTALIGARPEVLAKVVSYLEREPYNAEVVLARDGYQGSSNSFELAAALRKSRPTLVFVAMGSPRQEQLIVQLRDAWPQAYYLGLGGSFDVFAGRVKRAPPWVQKLGLEWFYRLVGDPRRIKRQIKYLEFMMRLKMGKL